MVARLASHGALNAALGRQPAARRAALARRDDAPRRMDIPFVCMHAHLGQFQSRRAGS
jgi:hypothetical protein